MLGLVARLALSRASQSGGVLGGISPQTYPLPVASPPVFNADEFGFLQKNVREEILDVVTSRSSNFYYLETDRFSQTDFLSNKKLITRYFLTQLFEKFISENKGLESYFLSQYRSAVQNDASARPGSVFRIVPIIGSPDVFMVNVPFGTANLANSSKLIKAAKSKLQLIGDGTPGGSSILVSKQVLEEIYIGLKAKIDLQKAELSIGDFVPRVREKKALLNVDEHPYADIYEGTRGIAYRGRGLGGLLYSLPASLFEAKPKNNLGKVIRLFRNYQNQMKSATHTHTTEVSTLITELEKLTPLYKSMKPEEVDLVIVGRLQGQFETWSEAQQTGSAMRRVVFAIDQIIPAGISSGLAGAEAASSAAGSASISGGPR